jgi:hypothetical protein
MLSKIPNPVTPNNERIKPLTIGLSLPKAILSPLKNSS